MFTVPELTNTLPSKVTLSSIQELVNEVNNNSINIPQEDIDVIKENFVTYSYIINQGRYKLSSYLEAIKYVSYKTMGYTNRESYEKTFPSTYLSWVKNNISSKDINARINSYNKNKLVNLIFEQSHIPSWILNQDAYQKAINTQLDIMKDSKSDMARVQAANSLLTHLKKPEVKEIDINIKQEDNSKMKDLNNVMDKLANLQNDLIKSGQSTDSVNKQPIIDVTPNK